MTPPLFAPASTAGRRSRWAVYTAFGILALLLVSLHTYRFEGRSYRNDEAWVLHAAIDKTVTEDAQWIALNIHPPLYQLVLDFWYEAAGQTEALTRFSSTLFTLLAFAAIFRLAADLFDWRVGLFAVVLFGTFTVYQFYGHELRPYAVLVAGTALTQLTFLRWIQRATVRHALAFVGSAIATWFVHFYAIFLFPALILVFVLLVRWDWRRYVRMLGLFAAIGFAFTAWLLPFLHAILVQFPGGIPYSIDDARMEFIYRALQLKPAYLGELLLVAAVFVPVLRSIRPTPNHAHAVFRFGAEWRKGFVAIMLFGLLALIYVTNQYVSSLTLRNLMIIFPSLAILLALGLRALPWQVAAFILLIVGIASTSTFEIYNRNGPYLQLVDAISPRMSADDRFIIDGRLRNLNIVLNYYVRERLPFPVAGDQIFHLMEPLPQRELTLFPDIPVHLAMAVSPDTLDAFEAFLDTSPERLWYLRAEGGIDFAPAFTAPLEAHFLPLQDLTLPIDDNFEERNVYHLIEYRRIPDELAEQFVFDDSITLQNWELRTDVNVSPCQSVLLDSWWTTRAPLTDNYSLTLVLADARGQGIARADGNPSSTLTQQWQPSALYFDSRTLTIPCDVPPGDYPLLIGLYDPDNPVAALPAHTADGADAGNLVYLTGLTVH